ncbi:hypothetical protein DV515_00017554, partial [Chloebia gouldiae]
MVAPKSPLLLCHCSTLAHCSIRAPQPYACHCHSSQNSQKRGDPKIGGLTWAGTGGTHG